MTILINVIESENIFLGKLSDNSFLCMEYANQIPVTWHFTQQRFNWFAFDIINAFAWPIIECLNNERFFKDLIDKRLNIRDDSSLNQGHFCPCQTVGIPMRYFFPHSSRQTTPEGKIKIHYEPMDWKEMRNKTVSAY